MEVIFIINNIDGVEIRNIVINNVKTRYYVTYDGFIYSLKKSGKFKKRKLQYDKDGYVTVGLRVEGKLKFCRVNRLVAQSFIPNPYNKKEVNHIDGDPDNNCVDNLEWNTRKENMDHAWRTGLTGVGEKSSAHKLNEAQVNQICLLLQNTDLRYKEISNIIGPGCTIGMIKTIAYGKGWVDISANYDFSKRISKLKDKNKQKLNKSKVTKICIELAKGKKTLTTIAKEFNVTYDQIANIKFHKTWKEISSQYNF